MVVCGPCSNKKWVLPSQSAKPLRVCLTCYDELSRARADDNRLAGDTRGQYTVLGTPPCLSVHRGTLYTGASVLGGVSSPRYPATRQSVCRGLSVHCATLPPVRVEGAVVLFFTVDSGSYIAFERTAGVKWP